MFRPLNVITNIIKFFFVFYFFQSLDESQFFKLILDLNKKHTKLPKHLIDNINLKRAKSLKNLRNENGRIHIEIIQNQLNKLKQYGKDCIF